MAEIEVAVQEAFARNSEQQSSTLPTRAGASSSRATAPITQSNTPFAKVDDVSASSPAADAGLKVGDRITRFGTVDWLNHENLRKVAEVVSQNQGVCSDCLIPGFREDLLIQHSVRLLSWF